MESNFNTILYYLLVFFLGIEIGHIQSGKIFGVDITLTNIYLDLAIFTGITILIGNLISLIDVLLNDLKRAKYFSGFEIFLNLMVYSMFSLIKSLIYAIIWPIFIPYAIIKAKYMKEQLKIVRKSDPDDNYKFYPKEINLNGLWPHFIPVHQKDYSSCEY